MATPTRTDAIKRARAVAMVAERIRGKSLQQIATAFNCSYNTVERVMRYANENGLVEQFEQQVISELVPLAIKAYKDALAKGDTFVAKDVLAGMGITKKQREAPRPPSQGDEDMDLEIYLRKRSRSELPTAPAIRVVEDPNRGGRKALPAGSAEGTQEGVVLGHAPGLEPVHTEAVGRDHVQDRLPHPEGFVDLSAYLEGRADESEVE